MIRHHILAEHHPKLEESTLPPIRVLSKGWELCATGTEFCQRVPCKARNVPGGDHNTDNAYILIPRDVQHGTVLKCSHSVCASSGRRFQYCAFCNTLVAQRNFAKRHSHNNNAKGSGTDATACKKVREETSGMPREMKGVFNKSTLVNDRPRKEEPSTAPPQKRMRVSVTKVEYECLLHLRTRPADAAKREEWLDKIWKMTTPPDHDANVVSLNDDDETVLSEISHSSMVAPHEFESDWEGLFD